jgi:endonuclease/exonuclease/phosphatase family metal-dependent hydrolase
MNASPRPIRRALLAAAALATALGCADLDQPSAPAAPSAPSSSTASVSAVREPFSVYTQNAYLGGDTDPIFSLDFNNIPAVIGATNTFWAQVQASRVPERAAGMVDEIEADRPHLVALDEAVQFLVLDMGAGGAVVQSVDLLGSIQSEIARRGLPYELVRAQENTQVTLPLSARLVLRVTDRVAVLRRTDVAIESSTSANYAARFTLGPVTLKRGWVRVRTTFEGQTYNVVATHLEGQRLAPVQAGQTAELIHSVSAGLDGVTMIAGDLNSDAANPGAPSWTPTHDALLAAGFTDLWERGHGGEAGYTCCQESDLLNGEGGLDQRIDFVLAKDDSGPDGLQGLTRVDIVGEELADRTASGLWRSDHAGLVASLKLARREGAK